MMLKEKQKETNLLMEMYSKTSFNMVKFRKRNLVNVEDREREEERQIEEEKVKPQGFFKPIKGRNSF